MTRLSPRISGLSVAGGRKCRKMSRSRCLYKTPVSSFSHSLSKLSTVFRRGLRSPFVMGDTMRAGLIGVQVFWLLLFFLLRERVNGETARTASLGYTSFGQTFLPSTSPHPSLSLLHPAAVARCSHWLDHGSVVLQADLATQVADDASKAGDCQALAFPLRHQKKKPTTQRPVRLSRDKTNRVL